MIFFCSCKKEKKKEKKKKKSNNGSVEEQAAGVAQGFENRRLGSMHPPRMITERYLPSF
jgi:archaellum component FlaC